jgi:hypothetical protein
VGQSTSTFYLRKACQFRFAGSVILLLFAVNSAK